MTVVNIFKVGSRSCLPSVSLCLMFFVLVHLSVSDNFDLNACLSRVCLCVIVIQRTVHVRKISQI